MLSYIRNLSEEGSFISASRARRVVRTAGQMFFFLYLSVFVCDTINIDVLYASLRGSITFVDDSSISDSLFDTGSSNHNSAFDAPAHRNDHQSFSTRNIRHLGADQLMKNLVFEDEDSPGVADAILSSLFAEQAALPRPRSDVGAHDTIPWLDRTISYQRILI